MSDAGALLVIRSHASDERFCAFRESVSSSGRTIASCRLHEVEALEPGTCPAHTLVVGYEDKSAARAAYAEMPIDTISTPSPPLVLLTAAVPNEGFDDAAIPTRANVGDHPDDDPVLLIIEGSASDAAAMDQYRDIILPMMFDRHAYYTVFELGGNVDVLSGEWDEAIFAISRWPSRALARDFWLSEQYQTTAIPLRIGIGRFQVAAVPDAG